MVREIHVIVVYGITSNVYIIYHYSLNQLPVLEHLHMVCRNDTLTPPPPPPPTQQPCLIITGLEAHDDSSDEEEEELPEGWEERVVRERNDNSTCQGEKGRDMAMIV